MAEPAASAVFPGKATIDNSNYGYWLECWSDYYPDLGIGIYGADVIYTITAAKG